MHKDIRGQPLKEGFYREEPLGMIVYFIGKYDAEGKAIVEGARGVSTYSQINTSELVPIEDFEEYLSELAELMEVEVFDKFEDEEIGLNLVWLGKKRSQLEEKVLENTDEIPF